MKIQIQKCMYDFLDVQQFRKFLIQFNTLFSRFNIFFKQKGQMSMPCLTCIEINYEHVFNLKSSF